MSLLDVERGEEIAAVPSTRAALTPSPQGLASAPSHHIEVPAPVNDLALASDGTLLAATDEGLYTTRLGG